MRLFDREKGGAVAKKIFSLAKGCWLWINGDVAIQACLSKKTARDQSGLIVAQAHGLCIFIVGLMCDAIIHAPKLRCVGANCLVLRAWLKYV